MSRYEQSEKLLDRALRTIPLGTQTFQKVTRFIRAALRRSSQNGAREVGSGMSMETSTLTSRTVSPLLPWDMLTPTLRML